ncbi:hydroxymethylglutaryl-CoA lyase [Kutzneria sp. CA-103260]|uniref:hydroxymethylglutaryl-CoA lyase n=1 Tax=Kutzneria sp. CA-103260 TaxID=2802641 RepID=UPI001BF123AF|nr:hydroxymethylglutaryl-CoA lyase [Kutzneria sp. CA-103260]QUQ64717.1 hydroxymethylglutaryl-CoA lyase [Kutzneria sp. CA-103260]
MNEVVVRDVTLRDGLQLVRAMLPTADKIALVRFLLDCGLPQLEIGAVVRPDRVPTMADTLEVVATLDATELARCWVLVPNATGARRAVEAGVRQIQYVLSVSPSHNKANVGCDVGQSLDGLAASVALARENGVRVQLGLATAFTCPFEGHTPEESVLALVADDRVSGVDTVMVCDTIGQAVPAHVAGLVAAVREVVGTTWFHGHDTWGLGVANTWAALGAGAVGVDATLGGLGGCPFAPGASGNTALEDVLYALRPGWLTPPVYHRILARGQDLVTQLGEPSRSRAADGALRSPDSHPWALGVPQ